MARGKHARSAARRRRLAAEAVAERDAATQAALRERLQAARAARDDAARRLVDLLPAFDALRAGEAELAEQRARTRMAMTERREARKAMHQFSRAFHDDFVSLSADTAAVMAAVACDVFVDLDEYWGICHGSRDGDGLTAVRFRRQRAAEHSDPT